MVSIKRLIIENFQSHENTILEFDEGLNIISGPSDNGKSAMIRAIKWLLFNEPRGTDFIRQGSQMARVTLEMNNGNQIIRERSKSINRYLVKYSGGEDLTFEGWGNEIPEEVKNAHMITKALIDSGINSSLNISGQLEGPFLLSESGAVRAKAIGRLSGLHIIDRAIKDCNSDLRRESHEREILKNEIQTIDQKLEDFKNLSQIQERLKKSQNLIEQVDGLIEFNDKLERNFKNILQIDIDYNEQNDILNRLDKLNEYEIILKSCEIKYEKFKRLIKINDTLQGIDLQITDASRVVEKTSDIEECSEITKTLSEKARFIEKITSLYDNIRKYNKELYNAKIQLDNTKNIYELERCIRSIEDKMSAYEELINIQQKSLYIEKEENNLDKVLDSYNVFDEISKAKEEIKNKSEVLSRLEVFEDILFEVMEKLKIEDRNIKSKDEEIEKLVNEYAALLRAVGKCPLCGSEIESDMLSKIIKSYKEVH